MSALRWLLDTQIAAHAMAEGRTQVTHDVRHVEDTPGLLWVDWMDAG